MVKFLGSHQGEMDLRAAHQQLKEELGFDHFEGRSWQGLHCHAHDDDPHMPSVRGVVCAARLKNEEDRPNSESDAEWFSEKREPCRCVKPELGLDLAPGRARRSAWMGLCAGA
jgi:hypothetical protein